MPEGTGFVLGPDAPRTFPDWIRHKAAKNHDKVALTIAGRDKSYIEIDHDTDRAAAGLAGLGVTPGDHAGIWMKNSLEFVDGWFGMTKAGVVEVPIHHASRGAFLEYVLGHADVKVLLIDDEFVPHLAAVAGELSSLEHVVVYGQSDAGRAALPSRIVVHDFASLYSDGPPPEPSLDRRDATAILHTSGTTGPPKGAVISHESALHTARHLVWLMDYTSDDRLYTAFPLFHNNAKYTSVLAAMECDGSLYMDQRFSVSRFWDICRREGITAFNYMGALLMMLMKKPERPDDADNPARIAFGAPCPVEIWEPFEERFGVKLVEVYGMTEAPMACENRLDDRRIGSAGKESMSYEVRVVDEHDVPVPAGETGEIVARPKRPDIMFNEYYRRPEDTLEAFRNLWFHTGDRGRMDEDGFLFFVDRMKDSIRRRGENISTWEVESTINAHPEVQESAAYGVESELTEHEVMVSVVLVGGSDLSPERLLDYCQTRMAYMAVPRYVRIAAELPKNHAERVQKFKLRALGVTDDTWDREEHGYEVKR
jgi:crotonobetaine/carnitine-CoA ligase